ncbi:MAG: nitroreductase family protein [Deltaproteobacteria bacterium]|nr:nitroreductase family protein [Deltaproteobacteria bacterium]
MAKGNTRSDLNVTRRAFMKGLSIGAISATAPLSSTVAIAAENPTDAKLFDIIYSLRSIRRLKPDPIPEEVLRKIVEAGVHAPTGGNRQDWGFILVRDPEIKTFIRDRYRDAQQKSRASQPPLSDLPPDRQRAIKASIYLSEHMNEAPVILLACHAKEYPAWVQAKNLRGSTATVHGSIYPAVQNILLACRAYGIGSVLTTTHFFFEDELMKKVGVPATMEVAALLPMGYPRGKLGTNKRKPVDDVLYWDTWGKKKA